MSEFEHIYLYTGGDPVQKVADRVAAAISGEVVHVRDDVIVKRPMSGLPEGWVRGQVAENMFYENPPDSAHRSVSDLYDISIDIRCSPRPDEFQLQEAARVFDDLVGHLDYPALLMHSFDFLVAASAPAVGRTDFPSETSPDEDGRDLWAPYGDPATITGISPGKAH